MDRKTTNQSLKDEQDTLKLVSSTVRRTSLLFSQKVHAKYFPQERLCITTDDQRLHTFQPHKHQSGCHHIRGVF